MFEEAGGKDQSEIVTITPPCTKAFGAILYYIYTGQIVPGCVTRGLLTNAHYFLLGIDDFHRSIAGMWASAGLRSTGEMANTMAMEHSQT